MDKKILRQVVELYVGTSDDADLSKIAVGKEVKEKQEQALQLLKQVTNEVKNPEQFIEELKPFIDNNEEVFAEFFFEPYLDDFLNTLLLDLHKKELLDDKEFKKLKKKYKEQDIDIYI